MNKTNLSMIFLITIAVFSSFTYAETYEVTAITLSLINQNPDPVIAGETFEVRIGVENIGSEPAKNLIVEVDPEYPFELLDSTEAKQTISTLNGYQYDDNQKILKFKLKASNDASAGTHSLTVKYYEEGSGAVIQKDFDIEVKNSESAEIIFIDKTTLIPGEETPIKFTINNMGSANLNNIIFKWVNEDNVVLPVGSDNTKHINSLKIGESKELEYTVIADTNAEPGLYKLDLTLTYDDSISGSENEIQTIAGVYVGGTTDFEVTFSETANSETSFSIANIGSNPAYSVTVSIPEQDGWRTTGSDSSIIGNLNNGDYTISTFTLQKMQNGGKTEDLPIIVKVTYTDTKGLRQSVEKEVKMSSSAGGNSTIAYPNARMGMRQKPGSTSSGSNWVYYVGGAVILAIGIYVFYRKRKTKTRK